jgi:GNAT superfamily N-acetyltransferase
MQRKSNKKEHILKYIANNDDKEKVFVARSKDEVIGWIDCKIIGNYFIEDHCEIEGLVVDKKERDKGIGKVLLQSSENWAKQNIVRERAHNFYLANGYKYINQSKKFIKMPDGSVEAVNFCHGL